MTLLTNLLSYYKLDEVSGAVLDAISSRNGTLSGSYTQNASGKILGALRGLSGTGAVDFGNVFNFTDADDFSISFWFKYDGAIASNNAIISKFNSYNVYINSNLRVAIPGIAAILSSSVSPSVGSWYHVVLTHSSTAAWRLYVNGSLDVGPTTQTGILHDTSHFNFFNEPSAHFNGYLDEVGIWDRLLDATDVSNLWNGGAGLPLSSFNPTSAPSVDTAAATDITENSATLNGEITDIGTSTPDEEGFVWGTSTQADPGDVAPASAGYDDYFTDSGSFSAATFDHAITGLTNSTTYYVRAYAHNADGYAYGPEISFDTNDLPLFRFTNLPGIEYDPDDTTTIFAERLNDIMDRLDALEA